MVARVVLHIGTMKSGTSHLQSLLFKNKETLGARDVLVPGRGWPAQLRAVTKVLERDRGTERPLAESAWTDMRDEINAHDQTAVMSVEFLAGAGPRHVNEVVESFPGAEVDVVITARDLGRGVPAMWQEHVKVGGAVEFEDYVHSLRPNETPPANKFWRNQRVAAIAHRWAEEVGPSHVHVVTVPPRGSSRDTLWRRFAHVLRVPAGGIEVPGSGNESLGAASAEVVRRVNTHLPDLPRLTHEYVVKRALAKGFLAPRRAREPAIGFEVPDWVKVRGEEMAERIDRAGYHVVGDLADLSPVSVAGVNPSELEAAALLEPAEASLTHLAELRAMHDSAFEPGSAVVSRRRWPLARDARRLTEVVDRIAHVVGTWPTIRASDPPLWSPAT